MELLKQVVKYIQDKHTCHTIILYGSHARGEATDTSDIDILAIRGTGEFERDCCQFEGRYLDAFIYPVSMLSEPDSTFIRAKDGIVLCQNDHIGDELLAMINDIYQKGPPLTPDWEKQEIRAWLPKMLARAKVGDLEGDFRRHWLLRDALECYFKLRGHWYLGPKESFQWLKQNDLDAYKAFEEALKPGAELDKLEQLVKLVIKE